MALPVTGQVGEVSVGGGTQTSPIRQGNQGDVIVSELHGRFYEENFRGRQFGFGLALTAINNATFTSATLGPTGTPIIGIWNPINSGVNAEVLQATLQTILTALTATGPGGFAWYGSVGNQALPSTGSKGLSRFGFSSGKVQGISGVAMTGQTNALVLVAGSALGGGQFLNASNINTAAGAPVQAPGACENLDGSFIVPPGGILALLAQTTPVAHSVVSGILWNEVPPTV